VPFGLDWKVYPSVFRKLVSGPLVVERTHGFWNDYGVQGYAENRWFNAVVFGLNGFGYDRPGSQESVEMNLSSGGRLGFKPFSLLEVGTSYSGFMDNRNRLDMTLLGQDFQLAYRALTLKGEYITHKMGLADGKKMTESGLYAEGLYDFGRFFLVGRYDTFSPWGGERRLSQFSSGIGWVVLKGCEVRFEYQARARAGDITFTQVVVSF
jgi:hypothetical protein